MSNETDAPPSCLACRTIDRADGVEDGRLYPVVAKRIRHETAVVRKIRTEQSRLTDGITNFAGSMSFVYLHTIWFGVWILINLGLLGAAVAFDRFPFGLLTMIVSLEAIFLSTFVMISQNRQASRADIRSELDFENNVRGEIWAVHIGHALGIDADHVEETVMTAIKGYREMENA
ncbi:MAG: hypothetical protein QOH66_250 [Actinomycetota bacterium]|nr:hypothetical protein [Actinomycetota bacterium]